MSKDSPTSDAPVCSLDVEVLPPENFPMAELQLVRGSLPSPLMRSDWRKAAEVIWRDLWETLGLNGQRGICMGRAPEGERWLIALPGGRRVNVQMSNIRKLLVTWMRMLCTKGWF